ncbi:MAG: tRNA pseudouridine(38-40) synthase TruA [Tissierellales bacterium]|nr:tRNA pseudouridine(38-40) synthase TruA [Tissierellales bacterium]
MKNIKMILEYDGSKYQGWQKLGNTENTIQSKIEKTIKLILNEDISLIGSGRTDAGVHAKGQVANFKTNSEITMDDFIYYMNIYLPKDIVVKDAKEASERFHARYNAKSKVYSYYIYNDFYQSPFYRKYSYHISDKLNIDNMLNASKLLVGKHDYKAFSSVKSKNKSTIKTVHSIEIEHKAPFICIRFEADGFLYNMVRILAGTIIEVGKGIRDINTIYDLFDSKNRAEAGFTAPAHGLFLEEVKY